VNYPSDRKSPVWPRPASLVVFALLIGAFAISCSGASGEQRTESPAGGDSQVAVDLEHPSLGDEGAPVVLTEYADYQ
jgi:protein-disulfide isomerase